MKFLSSLQETLESNPSATQREIAAKQGISLGMTNAWLGKLADKGWVLIHKINRKNVRYALTAEGMRQITLNTANYMRKTFSLMKTYGNIIEKKVCVLKDNGYSKIVLAGKSNIDFLLEYSCQKIDMQFEKTAMQLTDAVKDGSEKVFYLAGEDVQQGDMTSVFEFIGN
ncbi:MAG: winged helix-turn-helix transcriptional regulator [Treponema sp.]|nr:winged helix-turn-helix transcriptional regulator [Treponema sp.]